MNDDFRAGILAGAVITTLFFAAMLGFAVLPAERERAASPLCLDLAAATDTLTVVREHEVCRVVLLEVE